MRVMNEAKHTKEPWQIYCYDRQQIITAPESGRYKDVICDLSQSDFYASQAVENARRIVACVNACRGMPTKELEDIGLVGAVGTVIADLERQLDYASQQLRGRLLDKTIDDDKITSLERQLSEAQKQRDDNFNNAISHFNSAKAWRESSDKFEQQNAELREAWMNYNKIDSSYTYSLEEGGDCEYTKEEHRQAWIKLNDLFKSNKANSGAEG